VIAARPIAKTSVAHTAPPRSCGGLAGHSQGDASAGGCQSVYNAYVPANMKASGPVQDRAPPSSSAHSSPMPVIPATLRSTSRPPPARFTPAPAASSTATAARVSAAVVPSRRIGSHRPVARSGSPNGLPVVIAMTAAQPDSKMSGSCSAP